MGKTYKRIFITIVTILSMLAYIFIVFTPIITAQAASTYKLTVSWGEGIEWVATDKDGVNRWTNGSTKSFSENTSAYTYIKLKPGYRLDCLSADAEWADWTTVSNNLVYDTWSMYNNRTVSIKVISDVFKENGERYTYNGNYSETGYKLVEVSSWECTHSLSLDNDNDIIGYIESNPSNIDEGERLKPGNSELLASIRTYTSDSRYKLRIGSAYVKYTGAAHDRYGNIASGNKYVSQYTLYVDSHNIANETGIYPEYGASKNNDWILASNYRCPDIDAGEEADYAGFAYYRNYYAYCKTTQMWYPVGSAHNWLGCAKGDIGANEFHPSDYTHTITKYKLVPVDYSISYNLNGGSVSENPTTYNVETNTFTLKNPTKPGYTFTGWTGSNGTTPQTTVSISKGSTGDKSYAANWKPSTSTYKVNYLLQNIGDDNYTLKESAEYTETINASVTPTVKTYTGFTSPAAQTVQVKEDGTTVVNYYYTRNSYLLTVNAGTGINSITVSNSAGISNIENTDKKKVLSVRYGASVTINADISPGYSWSRWDGSFTQWNKSYNFYMPAKAVNVTAIATANKYVVQLYANKPSDTSNLVVNNLSDSEWVYDNVNGCYTSTFTYDAAKNIPSPADTYSLKGYSASGWYTSATGGNNIFSGNMKWNLTTSYNGVVKLYARWTENEYKISFNYVKPDNASGDIQNNEVKEKNVKYNKPVGSLPEPTLTGWKFDGWYTAVTGGIKFTSDTKYLNIEDIVLFPHWTANKYTITFDSNKPAGSTDSVTGSMSNIYCTYDVPVQIPDNNFTLRGWDFVAWNTKADGSGIRYSANDTVSNLTSTDGATVTLYAEWDTHIEWNASLSKANKSFVNAMELSFEDKAVNWPGGIGYGIVMNNTLTYKEFGDMQGFLNVNISNVYPKSIKYEFSDSRINEVVLNDRAYDLTKINGKSTFEFMIDSNSTREFVQNISFTLPEYEAESDVISDKEYSAYVDISVTYQIYSTNREVTETRRVYYNVVELDLSKIHSRIRYQPGQSR